MQTNQSSNDQGDLLRALNEPQRIAVTHVSGPLLVLAGAGSGKTRVITHRIANLILHEDVQPDRILAVTFTNKAAAEMRERVQRRLAGHPFNAWIGTFHSLCLRILRQDGTRIGLAEGFNIYDGDDQRALVKRILKAEGVDRSAGPPRSFLSKISRAKNGMISPAELEKQSYSPEGRQAARIYGLYEQALRRANAVDFDDLLVRTLELFREHEEVAARYASRCEYLLVDEYQDTNRPQYLLVRFLTAAHGNICVVGDEDQSIYRFRGAELRNILEFEQDHPDTTVIRLEQNYRSSDTIIRAASAVIAKNVFRKGKTLWTDNDRGDPVELFCASDDRLEAAWVSQRIQQLADSMPLEEIAVLYRTNAQSRQVEEMLRRDRVPYQIVGSVQFYERKEIKDLLAYLKLAANPSDDIAFRRVVNTPTRGIGATTLSRIDDVARGLGLPLMEAAGHALQQGLLPQRAAGRLQEFLDFVTTRMHVADDQPVADLLERLVEDLDYEEYLEKAFAGQGGDRMENVLSLISAAAEYADEVGGGDLQGFLDRSALVAGADEVGERPGVTLMTIHCAKGLEFPAVFLLGLEEELFPHAMASGSDEDIEEERRLCYVAMTRAMKRLFVSHAAVRRVQGALIPHPPSRFLSEIPTDLIQDVSPVRVPGFFDQTPLGDSGSSGGGSSAARAANRRSTAPPPVVAGPSRASDAEDGYSVGSRVIHPRFGVGQIVNREGKEKHLKLTIHFSDHGQKKILPAYTKLRVES